MVISDKSKHKFKFPFFILSLSNIEFNSKIRYVIYQFVKDNLCGDSFRPFHCYKNNYECGTYGEEQEQEKILIGI